MLPANAVLLTKIRKLAGHYTTQVCVMKVKKSQSRGSPSNMSSGCASMKIKVNLKGKPRNCKSGVFPSTGARANKLGLHTASLHQMLVWVLSNVYRLAVSSMLTPLGRQRKRTKRKWRGQSYAPFLATSS